MWGLVELRACLRLRLLRSREEWRARCLVALGPALDCYRRWAPGPEELREMGLKDSRATRRVELQVTGPAQLPAMR